MFQRNDQHRQPAMFSSIYELPKKQLKRLEGSWAGTFYREFFIRVDEDLFEILYFDEPSRPTILAQGNIPVNVLMGRETLKSGFGWSDEECFCILLGSPSSSFITTFLFENGSQGDPNLDASSQGIPINY